MKKILVLVFMLMMACSVCGAVFTEPDPHRWIFVTDDQESRFWVDKDTIRFSKTDFGTMANVWVMVHNYKIDYSKLKPMDADELREMIRKNARAQHRPESQIKEALRRMEPQIQAAVAEANRKYNEAIKKGERSMQNYEINLTKRECELMYFSNYDDKGHQVDTFTNTDHIPPPMPIIPDSISEFIFNIVNNIYNS